MGEIGQALGLAAGLIWRLDPELMELLGRSLAVSATATILAAALGLPLGAGLALARFPGRRAAVVAVNAAMGLPPVVVGLAIYLLLSRAGPLGVLGLLFTPGAMILAQTVLVTPIIAALARQTLADLWQREGEALTALGASRGQAALTLLHEGRWTLLVILLAGFGRAIAEVGAVLIVGGNIDHVTRVMTTAITLEIARGRLALALALGIVLLAMSLTLNAAASLLSWRRAELGGPHARLA